MNQLELVDVDDVEETQPDKWQRVDLAASSIRALEEGRWSIRRDGSDDAHIVELVRDDGLGAYYGHCSCKGFQFHDGVCCHLCALVRAQRAHIVEIPRARVVKAYVELIDRQTELADSVDSLARADGGMRQW